MSSGSINRNAKWYVVHTYSGYENKVKTNIERIIDNRNLHDYILDIKVPTEDVIEAKGDEQKKVTRKIFPGYVLIKMVMTDDTWYIIRNTTGVTGFVGPGSKPVPLTEEEVESLGVDVREVFDEYAVGDNVRMVSGVFADSVGIVEKVDKAAKKVYVGILMMGKTTQLELSLKDIESI